MHSRWLNVTVVALWLATMSWLVVAKVLPPLLVGDPPSHRTVLEAQRREAPVGWTLALNGKPIGWAVSHTEQLPDGLAEVRSRVHFREVSLEELAPGWLRGFVSDTASALGVLQADAENVLTLDSFGRLLGFDSTLRFEPFEEVVELKGTVEGREMELLVRSGTLRYRTTAYLPSGALLGSALSPQSRLPGLRLGQSWTVPVYNPLRPRQPLEILEARVEGVEPVAFNGEIEEAWLVVYRSDSGSGLRTGQKPRGRVWVRRGREDGMVLKQEAAFFDSTITFVRLSHEAAVRLLEVVEEP